MAHIGGNTSTSSIVLSSHLLGNPIQRPTIRSARFFTSSATPCFAADHQWYNNKGAAGRISAAVWVYQDVPNGNAFRYYRDFDIWYKHLDNGDELVPFDLTIPIDGGVAVPGLQRIF